MPDNFRHRPAHCLKPCVPLEPIPFDAQHAIICKGSNLNYFFPQNMWGVFRYAQLLQVRWNAAGHTPFPRQLPNSSVHSRYTPSATSRFACSQIGKTVCSSSHRVTPGCVISPFIWFSVLGWNSWQLLWSGCRTGCPRYTENKAWILPFECFQLPQCSR